MSINSRAVLVLSILHLMSIAVSGQVPLPELQFTKQEIRVPMRDAGTAGLQTWLLLPPGSKKLTLAILTPDTLWPATEARKVGPGKLLPEAIWFLRRGWAVAIVLRRGMGLSGGNLSQSPVFCGTPNMESTGDADAPDIAAAVGFLSTEPRIDSQKIVVVGEGMGGTGAVSLGLQSNLKLNAVISISGSWNTFILHGWVCKSHVPTTFGDLSSKGHPPRLWVYSKQDAPIGQKNIVKIHSEFVAAGGQAELSIVDASRENRLPFAESPELWGPAVSSFLSRNRLPASLVFSEADPPAQKLPGAVSESMQNAFLRFQKLGPYKAFALGSLGEWGYSSGRIDLKTAEHDALSGCGSPTHKCNVVSRSTF
jgi:pimeloyl-ACP methyl ester carboxylesterase